MKKKNATDRSASAETRVPGKVIDLAQKGKNRWKRDKRYLKALEHLAGEIDETADTLFDRAFTLAVEGAWREWNDGVSEGAVIYIDEEMLRGSGDPHVSRLLDAREYLYCVANELRGTGGRGKDYRDNDDRLLDELVEEENRILSKEQNDDMQDYVDFMTGTGRYKD